MVVRVYKDADAIGKAAAALFAARVIEKPDCVLGLATGSTPIPTYKAMAELYKAGAVDYSKVTFRAPVEERKGGNALSAYLAFVPIDIKEITHTRFECYFVNDSNYYIQYTYLAAEGEVVKL